MRFTLNSEQHTQIYVWLEEQEKLYKKLHNIPDDVTPHYGAIGGELTYSFTPTTLGIVIKIKHNGTGNVLDVTDYDSW